MRRRWWVLGLVLLIASGLLLWRAAETEDPTGGPIDGDAEVKTPGPSDAEAHLAGRAVRDAAATMSSGAPREASGPTFPLTVSLYLVDVEPYPVRVWLRDGAGVVRQRVVEEGDLADFGEVAEGSMLAWAQGEGAAAIARGQSLLGLGNKPWTLEHVFLFPGGPLEGRVLDAATGLGIASATVRFLGLGSGASSPAWETATEKDGGFRLPTVPTQFCGRNGPQIRRPGLVVRAAGYGQCRLGLTWEDVLAGGPLQIELESGGAVTGRVVDQAGRPLAGVPVLTLPLLDGTLGPIRGDYAVRLPIDIAPGRTVCLGQAGSDFHPFPLQQALGISPNQPHPLATLTQTDGTYRLEGLTLGMRWVVVADVPERPLSNTHEVLLTANAPLAAADLRVERYGRLRLDVVDAEGHAIEGAYAWCVGLEQPTHGERGGLYGPRPLKPLENAEDGVTALILDPCPSGPVRVVMRAHGYVLQDVRLDADPAQETRHTVRLERGLTIHGCIEAPDGQPLYYAFVRAIPDRPEPLDHFFQDTWEMKTHESGLFQFAGLRPGRYRLDASHYLHRGVATTLTLESENVETNLRVLPLWKVELQFEAGEGTELPDMLLIKQYGEQATPEGLKLRFDRLRRGVGTHDMGEYAVLENGRAALPYREGQRYVIVAEEGYAVSIREIEPEHEATVVVRLERGRPLRGVVVAKDGSPVAGAFVAPMEAFFTGEQRVETDEAGRFAIPDLGSGPYELYAWARGFPEHVFPVDSPANGEPVRLVLPRGVRVDGTVWSSKERPALIGTRVTISRGTDDSLAFVPVRTARTDVRGEFTVHLDPGRYRLEAEHEGRSARVTVNAAEPMDGRIEITLAR